MLPALRNYLSGIPNLGALMDKEVTEGGVNVNNFEELKTAREAARDHVLNQLRETRQLHTVIMYPEIQDNCATCGEYVKGGYVELNNAATGKGLLIPMFVWHQFLAHGVLNFVEEIVNLGNSKVSERPMPFPLQVVVQTMNPSIPPEVVAELQQFQQQMAAARQA